MGPAFKRGQGMAARGKGRWRSRKVAVGRRSEASARREGAGRGKQTARGAESADAERWPWHPHHHLRQRPGTASPGGVSEAPVPHQHQPCIPRYSGGRLLLSPASTWPSMHCMCRGMCRRVHSHASVCIRVHACARPKAWSKAPCHRVQLSKQCSKGVPVLAASPMTPSPVFVPFPLHPSPRHSLYSHFSPLRAFLVLSFSLSEISREPFP